MKLIIEQDWECFTRVEQEFADFSIITGLNGVGKTMLLNAIHQTYNGNDPTFFKGIIPLNILDAHGEKLNHINFFPLGKISVQLDRTVSRSNTGRGGFPNEIIDTIADIAKHYTAIMSAIRDGVEPTRKMAKGFHTVAQKVGKDVYGLSENDIIEQYELSDGYPYTTIFSANIGRIVNHYETLKHANFYKTFENERRGTSHEVLTDEQFIENYGHNPISRFNELFESCDLPYRVQAEKQNMGQFFNINFININTDEPVHELKLSSGEQVLLAAELATYNINTGSIIQSKLILFDEPDASLHPSMIKRWMDTLEKIFINNGISIIMTTHSPSTVALAPDTASIYLMEKNPTKFINLTKDEAISKLTAGVPTLSVRIENRRVVFVESLYDAKNLELFFDKIKEFINPAYSLAFIAPEINNKSSCEKVRDMLEKLDDVPTVYGIIDFDNHNTPRNRLHILGQGGRYAIENYILDPLLLGAFLVEMRVLGKQQVGLKDSETHLSLVDFNDAQLQTFSDKVIDELIRLEVKLQAETEKLASLYANGHQILIPKWFATTRGHDIEEMVYKRFPDLNQVCRKGENNLLNRILINIVADMPGFIPIDIVETMRKLTS